MLYYPKMLDSRHLRLERCVVFEKLDGTNLHWDWDSDFGWHAFGTRRDCFNPSSQGIAEFESAHPNLAGAAGLFHGLGAALEAISVREPYAGEPGFTVFTECLGSGSFAGLHRAEDEKRLVLFDVLGQTSGMLGPFRFVSDFGHLPIPRVVFQGRFTGQLAHEIAEGRHGVGEGVVVKGDGWMAKLKTRAYRERLQEAFAADWEVYWE